MANPISREDLDIYFSSAKEYAPIRQKAKFALRAAKWEERSDEEIEILTALSLVTEDEAKFLHSLKTTLIQFDAEKVRRCVKHLLEKKKIKKEADLKTEAAHPIRKDPLHDEALFLEIVEPVKLALQNELLSSHDKDLGRQVIGMERLLEQCMPFEEAVTRCFGEGVLKKIIPDIILERMRKANPSTTRESIRDEFLGKMIPLIRESKRSYSESAKPVSKPGLLKRSHTVTEIRLGDALYPEVLLDQSTCRLMFEGATAMKFLFVAAYEKNFSTKVEKEVVEQLFDYYLRMKYLKKQPIQCLEASFKNLLAEHRDVVLRVCDKLLAKQTISKLKKPPRRPSLEPLPPLLVEEPFHDEKNSVKFIKNAIERRYVYLGIYHTYSKKAKEWVQFFAEVSFLIDFMGYDFKTAVRYRIGDGSRLDDKGLLELKTDIMEGMNLIVKEEEGGVAPEELISELRKVHFFQDLDLFQFLIEFVHARLPKIVKIETAKLCRILLMIHHRISIEPISLQDAIRDTFTLATLRRLYSSEDDARNLKNFLSNLSQITPNVQIKHHALSTEESFLTLCRKSKQSKSKIALRLQEMETRITGGLRWDLAILWYFNFEALREFYDNAKDSENIAETIKGLDEIIK